MVRYQEMIVRDAATEVATMEMTWSDKVRAEEGRRMVVRLTEHRFGPLAEEDRRRIQAIESTDELERLYDRLLEARSLEELGLNGG